MQEYLMFLINTKKVNELTQYRYCMWMKDFEMSKISQDYINEYVQSKGNHSQIRGAMLSFFEMLGLHKIYDMPPKASGRKKKRIIKDVSLGEVRMVSDYLHRISLMKGLIFDLAYQGALRRFEVPTIQLNSFKWIEWLDDITKPCRLIIQGKGDKDRTVLINPTTAERIFEYYRKKYELNNIEKILMFANSPDLLFLHKGKQMTEFMVWKIIRNGSVQALGRKIRTHELRHARATELERMGVPIKDIKNYLGHSSLATTEIYLHTSEQESIENIENILTHREGRIVP